MAISLHQFKTAVPPIAMLEFQYPLCLALYSTAQAHIAELIYEMNLVYAAENEGELLFYSQEQRAKSWKSVCIKLWEKLRDKRPTQISEADADRAFGEIHDFVGARIEVEYHDKILPAVNAFRRYFAGIGYETNPNVLGIPAKNYLEDDEQGYRAYHFFIRGPVPIDIYGSEAQVLFEIQVRSSFQHAWARTFHNLVYDKFRTQITGIPEEIRIKMRDFSLSINACDLRLISLYKDVKGNYD